MRALLMSILIMPTVLFAQDWTLQDDAGIAAALNDRTVRYDALTLQFFGNGGDTVYTTERSANGRWAARGGQYCSVWPPSDVWTCYDFYRAGDQVRFVGADRSESVGTILE